jgi:HlyD family secretion protein
MKRIWITIGVIVIVLVGGFFAYRAFSAQRTAPRYLTAQVARADISANIQETGTVNPVNEVQVGTQVSGTISSLLVDYNSIVHKGQVLATLDPTSLQAAETQAQAAVMSAQANSSASQATVAEMAANAQSAEANYRKAISQAALAQQTLSRDQQLLGKGYISQSQTDIDSAAAKAAQDDVNAAEMAAAAARAQENVSSHQFTASGGQIASAQGQLQQASYNLARATITSPIDGIIVSRNVSIGQTVAASFQTPTLFVIASSLKDMQVDVSVDEADVGQLRTGQSAAITVPAYPNTTFKGTVSQIRINPTSVQNVVTYDAIVTIHDESSRLKPGMTANVSIAIAQRNQVLTVPVSALLFKPQRAPGGGTPGAAGAAATSATPAPIAGAPGSHVTVWTLSQKKATPVHIVIGLSDGTNFEVLSGPLKEGDSVIIGQLQSRSGSTSTTPLAGAAGAGPGR